MIGGGRSGEDPATSSESNAQCTDDDEIVRIVQRENSRFKAPTRVKDGKTHRTAVIHSRDAQTKHVVKDTTRKLEDDEYRQRPRSCPIPGEEYLTEEPYRGGGKPRSRSPLQIWGADGDVSVRGGRGNRSSIISIPSTPIFENSESRGDGNDDSNDVSQTRKHPSSIERVLTSSPGTTFRKMSLESMSPLQKNRKRSIDTSPSSNLIFEDPLGLHKITVSVQHSLVKKRGETNKKDGVDANATSGVASDNANGKRISDEGGLVKCTDEELFVDVGHDIENMVISVIATPKNKKSSSRVRMEDRVQEIATIDLSSSSIKSLKSATTRDDAADRKESDEYRDNASTTTSFTTPKKNLRAAFRSIDARKDETNIDRREEIGAESGQSLRQMRGRGALRVSPPTDAYNASISPPMMSPSACIPCKFFALGICEFGDSCRFSHNISPASSPSTLKSPHFQHLGHPMHPVMLMHWRGMPPAGSTRPDGYGAYGVPAPPPPSYMSHSPGVYATRHPSTVSSSPPHPPPPIMRHAPAPGHLRPRYSQQQRNRRRRDRSSQSSPSSSNRARRGARDHTRADDDASSSLDHSTSSERAKSDATASFHVDEVKSVDDIHGKVWDLTQDQRGCRVLQRLLHVEKDATLAMLLTELKPHLHELMAAPFGNYLFQKMIETLRPGSKELFDVVNSICTHITTAAMHVNGTRSAQKVIEKCSDATQQVRIAKDIRKRIRTLAVHSQATHVVLRAIDRFPRTTRSIVIDGVIESLGDIVRNSHGCRVAQISFDVGTATERDRMVREILRRVYVLAKDVRGNYAVQHVIKRGDSKHVQAVVKSLAGHFVELSKQKFASNVVEACLRKASMSDRGIVVKELLKDMLSLLNDQYGNYVVQRAMSECDESARHMLLEAAKSHAPLLSKTPGGRRVLQRIQAQWPTFDLGASNSPPR